MRGRPRRQLPVDGRELAAISAGGALGALGRAGLAQALPHAAGAWPWATLAVNLLGALVLGWTVARVSQESYGRPFLGIGVCGTLTTFATLQLELLQMLDAGRWALALAYAAVSLTGGLAAVRLGLRLAGSERVRA